MYSKTDLNFINYKNKPLHVLSESLIKSICGLTCCHVEFYVIFEEFSYHKPFRKSVLKSSILIILPFIEDIKMPLGTQ